MSSYLRPRVPGASIFFTVALAARGSDLLVREVAALREAVRLTPAERPFRIDAWVVLPDHLHCVWTLPEGDSAYPVRWSVIKARFALAVPEGRRRASHLARRERAVWQRRYWEHHVRGPEDHAALVRYCHINPVKHGFVAAPEAWPYSSIHRDLAA